MINTSQGNLLGLAAFSFLKHTSKSLYHTLFHMVLFQIFEYSYIFCKFIFRLNNPILLSTLSSSSCSLTAMLGINIKYSIPAWHDPYGIRNYYTFGHVDSIWRHGVVILKENCIIIKENKLFFPVIFSPFISSSLFLFLPS